MKNLSNVSIFLIFSILFICCSEESEQDVLPLQFQDFATVFNGEGISGIINLTFESQILISTDGTRYAWFEADKVQKEWNLKDSDGPFRNIDVESIETGMILEWATNPANLFIIYNDGDSYMNCNIYGDPTAEGNWNNDGFYFDDYRGKQNVKSKWGEDGTFPLDNIGAGLRTNYIGCLDDIDVQFQQYILIDQPGNSLTNYVVEDLNSNGDFDVSTIVNIFGAGCPPENHSIPFSSVGAATLYDSNDNALYAIYFSADGKKFCFYEEDSRVMSNVYTF